MTTRTFRPYEPDQILLLPPSLREWLPTGHLAYFLLDVTATLDLGSIMKTYGGPMKGTVPFDPRMMVGVLLYAYCVGVPSSRRIAKHLEEDIAFRVLAANQRPDFRTISEFRRIHLNALKGLFVQVPGRGRQTPDACGNGFSRAQATLNRHYTPWVVCPSWHELASASAPAGPKGLCPWLASPYL